jgi:hypothetical protein
MRVRVRVRVCVCVCVCVCVVREPLRRRPPPLHVPLLLPISPNRCLQAGRESRTVRIFDQPQTSFLCRLPKGMFRPVRKKKKKKKDVNNACRFTRECCKARTCSPSPRHHHSNKSNIVCALLRECCKARTCSPSPRHHHSNKSNIVCALLCKGKQRPTRIKEGGELVTCNGRPLSNLPSKLMPSLNRRTPSPWRLPACNSPVVEIVRGDDGVRAINNTQVRLAHDVTRH